MSGKIGFRENKNQRARLKLVKMIARKLKDDSIVLYKLFLMRMIAEYRTIGERRGIITTKI